MTRRPNILIIMVDQLTGTLFPDGPADFLHAPNLAALAKATGPVERVRAVIAVSFSPSQFQPEIIAAWLAFYVEAQRSPATRRLLRVYARRLHSNLMSGLLPVLPRDDAERAAEGVAALIDGLYIRRALKDGAPDAASAIALVFDYLDTTLAQRGKPS